MIDLHYNRQIKHLVQLHMYILQRLLTHKTPQMTQRYAHLRDDALKRAANLAGDIVKEIVSKK